MSKWYIFKLPRKPGDQPVKIHNTNIGSSLFELEAMRYGPIELISEEQFNKEKEAYEHNRRSTTD